ncbi:hypothetical protein M0805_001227, partial [Coniferiporia weirii]
LSSGDETGLGSHADLISGWDVSVLQEAIDQNAPAAFSRSSEIAPPFVTSINSTLATACTALRLVEEAIDGPLTVSPGCISIPMKEGAACPGLITPPIKGLSGASTSAVNTSAVASVAASSLPPPIAASWTAESPSPLLRILQYAYPAPANEAVADAGTVSTSSTASSGTRESEERRKMRKHRRSQAILESRHVDGISLCLVMMRRDCQRVVGTFQGTN